MKKALHCRRAFFQRRIMRIPGKIMPNLQEIMPTPGKIMRIRLKIMALENLHMQHMEVFYKSMIYPSHSSD